MCYLKMAEVWGLPDGGLDAFARIFECELVDAPEMSLEEEVCQAAEAVAAPAEAVAAPAPAAASSAPS